MKIPSWRWGLVFLAIFAGVVLTPYWITGYYQDDCINSVLQTYLKQLNLTFAQFLAREHRGWLFVHARLYPIAITIGYAIWQFASELWLYRFIQVSLAVSNVVLFAAMIRALGGGIRLSYLGGLVVLSLFQLRDFHDPLSSYAPLMQLGVAFGTGAVLLYSRALGWSLALYACALLVYETELAFLPVFLHLAFRSQPAPTRFLARWGHVLITAVYLSVVFVLRLTCPVGYDGTQIKLSLRALSTFLFQFSAALPLSYPIFGRSGFYTSATLISPQFLTAGAFAVFAAGCALFYLLLSKTPDRSGEPRSRMPGALKVFGWSLALMPPMVVALSRKYQDIVNRPGIGYLPVYLSYFGMAVLLAGALARSRRPRFMALVCGLVLATTFSTNWIAVRQLNAYWKDPRELLEKALRAGLLAELKPGDHLTSLDQYNWLTATLIEHYSGKVTQGVPLSSPKRRYLLTIQVRRPGQGTVALGLVDEVKWNPKDPSLPEQVLSSQPVKVVRIDDGDVRPGIVQQPGLDLLLLK